MGQLKSVFGGRLNCNKYTNLLNSEVPGKIHILDGAWHFFRTVSDATHIIT